MMSSKTYAWTVYAVSIIILCGTCWFGVTHIHKPSFSQIRQTREYQGVKRENANLFKLLEQWKAITAMTPFQFVQASTQDVQNIEFTINGQSVYLVGPGAEAAMEELR